MRLSPGTLTRTCQPSQLSAARPCSCLHPAPGLSSHCRGPAHRHAMMVLPTATRGRLQDACAESCKVPDAQLQQLLAYQLVKATHTNLSNKGKTATYTLSFSTSQKGMHAAPCSRCEAGDKTEHIHTHPAHIRPSTLPDAKVLRSKSCQSYIKPSQRFSRPNKPALPCCSCPNPDLPQCIQQRLPVSVVRHTHKQSLRPELEKACPRCHKDCMSCAHSTAGLSAARKPAGRTHRDRQLRACMA